jgi:hypothetical protein
LPFLLDYVQSVHQRFQLLLQVRQATRPAQWSRPLSFG